MKRFFATMIACLLLSTSLRPYTFNFTNGPANRDRWLSPPAYLVQPTAGSNISGTAVRSVTATIQSAFASWAAAPNASAVATYNGPATSPVISGSDRINTICFTCTGDFSQESSTLAITTTTTSTGANPGQLLDADIAFNPSRNFSTDGSGNQDLETVAAHEIGHFFGLSHSGVVRAVMYPFAPNMERRLGYDDVAGISSLYPGSVTVPTTSISGNVRLAGGGVFGAHVYAESQTDLEPFPASIRKTPISALTDTNGAYIILGVPNDAYRVTAEPLNLPVESSDVPDYPPTYNRTSVQTNFTTRWH